MDRAHYPGGALPGGGGLGAKDGTAYATNEYEGTVTVVPAGSPSPSHTIAVGAKDHPHGIAAAPDGTVSRAIIMPGITS
ncbi:hypothetical protein DQ354_13695 [Arthrobacter sp. AQ5-06]|nr:hypothetical protein DQ354_13695 [Arthrobacter sp. AQ5-06]